MTQSQPCHEEGGTSARRNPSGHECCILVEAGHFGQVSDLTEGGCKDLLGKGMEDRGAP